MVLYHSPSIYNKYTFSQNTFPISANCFFIAHINLNPLQLIIETFTQNHIQDILYKTYKRYLKLVSNTSRCLAV